MKRLVIIVILVLMVFSITSCMNVYEDLTLFRRKIVRTNLLTRQFGTYNSDTTISQLLTTEARDNNYSFNESTKLIYDTLFIGVDSTIAYVFDESGEISSIEYRFFFDEDEAENQINNVYEECLKYFGYPDEGYTRAIFEYLYKSPSVLWAKNNALMTLDFWMDDDLNTLGKFNYFNSSNREITLNTFMLPFTINALGDRIDSVISVESKNFSELYNSTVGYSYKRGETESYSVQYVFEGQYLYKVKMRYFTQNMSKKQRNAFAKDILKLMYEEFEGAYIVDNGNEQKTEIVFNGEAISISFYQENDNGDIDVQLKFTDFVH